MRNRNAHDEAGDSWCIQHSLRAPAIWVKASTEGALRWSQTPGRSGVWESVDERACFALDRQVLGAPLEAGWYELRGRCEVQGGESALSSLRLRYVEGSALTDLEILLPEPDAAGRIRRVLLFLYRVESLQFSPGIGPVRFRMGGFSLRRVSRMDALRTMLGGTAGPMSIDGIRHLIEWAGVVRRRGMKRATDELYAGYQRRMGPHVSEYTAWTCKYDTLGDTKIEEFRQRARLLGADGKPSISMLLCVGDGQEGHLRRCLGSALAQVWSHWELCVIVSGSLPPLLMETIAEYASRDSRIRLVPPAPDRNGLDAWPDALATARGEFIALLDQNGTLRPHSLLRVAECLAAEPDLAIVYSDEDRLDADGNRRDPHFKPDWNPDLLRSRNYVGGLTVLRTSLLCEASGLHGGFEGDRGHDLILRCSERVLPRQIRHLPEILYHGCASVDGAPAIAASGARAVIGHLERIGSAAEVRTSDLPPGFFHVRWPLPRPAPRVSVIVPTRDRVDMLRRCVESVLARSTYPDFELVVVDNGSTDRGTLKYLQALAGRERVRLLRYDAPFNFSAINNWAARQCTGQLLALVNNDVEVITRDWLEEMAGFAVRTDVGAVGAMLYYPDNTIQHAGMLLGIGGVAGHVYAGKPRGHGGYQGRALVAQNLSAVTGACLMVRRELFEAAGGFDEGLPVEFNDVDFCLRLGRQGYRNVWTPFAELYHHESASRALEDIFAKRMREDGIACMTRRWQALLQDDPAYNSNLSLQSLDFELGFPPRGKRITVRAGR